MRTQLRPLPHLVYAAVVTGLWLRRRFYDSPLESLLASRRVHCNPNLAHLGPRKVLSGVVSAVAPSGSLCFDSWCVVLSLGSDYWMPEGEADANWRTRSLKLPNEFLREWNHPKDPSHKLGVPIHRVGGRRAQKVVLATLVTMVATE